jgi:hypothetical protein
LPRPFSLAARIQQLIQMEKLRKEVIMFLDLISAFLNGVRSLVISVVSGIGVSYAYWMLLFSLTGVLSGMLFSALSHLNNGKVLMRNRAMVRILMLSCLLIETAGYLFPCSDLFICAAALSVPLAFCIAGFCVLELLL